MRRYDWPRDLDDVLCTGLLAYLGNEATILRFYLAMCDTGLCKAPRHLCFLVQICETFSKCYELFFFFFPCKMENTAL